MINARSPYIVAIDEVGQTTTKVEIFLFNGFGSTFPTTPQYTLTKKIPSSNVTLCTYNLSPYIQEYINHNQFQFNGTTNLSVTTNIYHFVNVKIKTYYNNTLIGTTVTKASNGYSYYSQGYNYDNGRLMLDSGNYNYFYSTTNVKDAGTITIDALTDYKAKYTDLVAATTFTITISANGVYDLFRVKPSMFANGNKVEIFDETNTLLRTYYFRPQEECKYTPVVIDFVNRYGFFQREFFYKASYNNFEVNNSEYNLMQSDLVNYSITEGQRKVFNSNGKETIKCNSGWVTEGYSSTIKEIMLSEKILVNSKPAKISTKQMEMQTSLNNKNINYLLEFEFAYESINSVV
jgi:hypothetical protein